MQSLESCWNYLRYATGRHVIVALGAGAYDIVSVYPQGLGAHFIETCPAQVVGVYSPGTDWDTIAIDADTLKHTPCMPKQLPRLLAGCRRVLTRIARLGWDFLVPIFSHLTRKSWLVKHAR
jgi:hypothetical protein